MDTRDERHSDQPAKILIVEDDVLNALLMEESLQLAGHEVVGAKTVSRALTLLEDPHIDAAIVDLQIGDQISLDVGRRLNELGIPWAITTGHAREEVDPEFSNVPILLKPFTIRSLLDLAEDAVEAGRDGHTAAR